MGFLTAFKFLTIFPLPQRWGKGKEDFGRSLSYFPLVGLVLGVTAACPQLWFIFHFAPACDQRPAHNCPGCHDRCSSP